MTATGRALPLLSTMPGWPARRSASASSCPPLELVQGSAHSGGHFERAQRASAETMRAAIRDCAVAPASWPTRLSTSAAFEAAPGTFVPSTTLGGHASWLSFWETIRVAWFARHSNCSISLRTSSQRSRPTSRATANCCGTGFPQLVHRPIRTMNRRQRTSGDPSRRRRCQPIWPTSLP